MLPGSFDGKRLTPCTPAGCLSLLKDVCGDLVGKHALVIGRSNIVGQPMAALLLQADCTVTIGHSRTRNLPALCREADIVVAAVGRPIFVAGDWLKTGAVVIDVGIMGELKGCLSHHLNEPAGRSSGCLPLTSRVVPDDPVSELHQVADLPQT